MKDITPFFSVVLITYNRCNLLPRCIDSVLNQSFRNLELIVVDNHSSDGSIELLNDYVAKDSRVKLLLVHNNNVLAYSRNEGVKISKGKYICILDSDDWYTLDKLECVYNAIQRHDSDVFYNGYTLMSNKGRGHMIFKKLHWKDNFHELLVRGNFICNTTTVIKKTAIQAVGYLSEDPSLRAVEDFDLWLKLSLKGYKFQFIDKMLGFYWVGNNMSYSTKQIQQVNNLYLKYKNDIDDKYKESAESTRHYINARTYHKIRCRHEAIEEYRLSFCGSTFMRKLQIVVLETALFMGIYI